jgi:hypothetical protein
MHPTSASMCLQVLRDPSKELGASMVYNEYWVNGSQFLEGYDEQTKTVQSIIDTFVNVKKIIGSWSIACKVIRASYKNPEKITDEDIMWAYAIGAGGGMEFEFPYE